MAASSSIGLLDMYELERWIQQMKKTQFLNKPESRKAKRFLIEQLISRGYNRGEIAERLGVSRKSVYNILKSTLSMLIPFAVSLPILGQTCFG